MNSQEIFDRLMKLRTSLWTDNDGETDDGDNALLYDVAKALDLTQEQAHMLAGDPPHTWIKDAEGTVEEINFMEPVPVQEFGIGRIGDVDPTMELLAEIEAVEISRRNAPERKIKLCDCGHYSAWSMSVSSGSSCPDCYDRMSE